MTLKISNSIRSRCTICLARVCNAWTRAMSLLCPSSRLRPLRLLLEGRVRPRLEAVSQILRLCTVSMVLGGSGLGRREGGDLVIWTCSSLLCRPF